MKKIITLFAAIILICSTITNAQTLIPNAGFENWSDANHATSWDATNVYSMLFTLQQSADAYSGNYAAKLTTEALVNPFPPNDTIPIPGALTLGIINYADTSIIGGIPFNDLADTLKGYIKYSPQNGDIMTILIFFWEYDTVCECKDTVGIGYFMNADTLLTYTEFATPIYWDSGYVSTPDSMNMICTSSGGSMIPQKYSCAYFDDFSLIYPAGTGVKEVSLDQILTGIYPNPTNGYINIVNEELSLISVYNLSGNLILQSESDENIIKLDMSDQPSGMYFIEVQNTKGRKTSKFILE